MLISNRTLPLALVLCLASTSPAAGVLVVDAAGGPGSAYADLPAAVGAAAPGDTVLVRSGSYSGFELLGKGVSVVAEAGAAVEVRGLTTISAVPAGEVALLRGLDHFWAPGDPPARVLFVQDCLGGVWIEDATFLGAASSPAGGVLEIRDSASVVVVSSTVTGAMLTSAAPFNGIEVLRSTLTLIDSWAAGPPQQSAASLPESLGVGLLVADSFVYAEGTRFEGADGRDGSMILVCVDGTDGGNAVTVTGTGSSFHGKQNTYVAGSGGTAPLTCLSGQSGVQVWVGAGAQHIELAGFARSFEVTSPVRELQSFTMSFDAQPLEQVFLLLGTEPLGLFTQPFNGSILVWGQLQIFPIGALGASGHLDLVLPMPPLPPGWASTDFYLQAAFLNAGGAPVLGGGSAVTVLDGSL